MILPDFVLPSRQNQTWSQSGLDTDTECMDKQHFAQYPHPVEYCYNSRGFRDTEWPNSIDQLQKATWCVGDSFTVGLGSPIEHTWPYLLQQQTQQRTMNVSMDGASNEWIARKTVRLLKTIAPARIVLHWSYLHRRELDIYSAMQQKWKKFYSEIKDPTWPSCNSLDDFVRLPQHIQTEINLLHDFQVSDEERRVDCTRRTTAEDLDNLLYCIQLVESCCGPASKIIHSFIPDFVNNQHCDSFFAKLSALAVCKVDSFEPLDRGRDGLHYDVLTSRYFVDQLMLLLD